MKYFLDTEFLEGTQDKRFLGMKYGETKPTIDLISIGIVCEDGREYYAISKDFNLTEAWNRYDLKEIKCHAGDILDTKNIRKNSNTILNKIYWIRDNVLKPIFIELRAKEVEEYNIAKRRNVVLDFPAYSFCFREFKRLINKYGKTNKQIAEEILDFVNTNGSFVHKAYDKKQKNKVFDDVVENYGKPQFYGYYSDYDWVVFCWLFGKMIDLPKRFPMYCNDLKQTLDEVQEQEDKSALHESLCGEYPRKPIQYKEHINYPKQTNEHNALADAIFCKDLYNFLNSI